MNSGPTAERIFDTLKDRILSGNIRPGDRLDPAILAPALGSSVTPVRDALNRLVGLELVETRTSGGFHLPWLDEPALRDRYDWNAALIGLWLRTATSAVVDFGGQMDDEIPTALATSAAQLFLAIVRGTGNGEHARAMQRLNDRMHAVRIAENRIIEDVAQELRYMVEAAQLDDPGALRGLARSYFRRRARHAADIVRAVYRAADGFE